MLIKIIPAVIIKRGIIKTTTHPPRVIILPIFCSRPLFVRGMPILRDMRAFAAETPKNLFQEKPPLFISYPINY